MGDAVAADWDALGPGDIGAVIDLHAQAVAAIPEPGIVRPETPAFFEMILGGGGWVCGWRDGAGRLGAYGVLQWALPPAEDLRPVLALPRGAPFAKLAGCSVRPDLWGAGLHDATIALRVGEAARRDLTELYATAAPGNARSWTNLVAGGFAVRARLAQYGGHLRYILHRSLDRPPSAAGTKAPAGRWIAAGDGAAEDAALADGLRGVAARIGPDGVRQILWVPQ
jgi:hypothetical protein